MLTPFSLQPRFLEKIWGAYELSPWFENRPEKTGEVWFTANDNQTSHGPTLGELIASHGPDLLGAQCHGLDSCPLLIKFLFTTEKLSVQVHPDDTYAREKENSRGKTEMWHILRAGPGAAVALGFRRKMTPEEVRSSIESGEIEDALNWVPVQAGDTFFTPAGTVHAIGANIALCEIQQNSDVTYRLYDYQRPRELHIEQSLAVADLGPYHCPTTVEEQGPGHRRLVSCNHFVTEELAVPESRELPAMPEGHQILIGLAGEGRLAGEQFRAGQVWMAPAGSGPLQLDVDQPVRLLRTFCP